MLHIKYFNFSRLSFAFYSKGSLPSNDTKALLISKTHLESEQKKGNSECKMAEKDLRVHLVDTSCLELRETGRPRGICPIDLGAVAAGEKRYIYIPVWTRRMFSGPQNCLRARSI